MDRQPDGLAATPVLGRRPRTAMFVGKNMSRTRCTGALVEALRINGVGVTWHNMATLRRWLGRSRAQSLVRKSFLRRRPDMVFIFCQDLPRDLLEEFREDCVVVLWAEESLEDLSPSEVDYFTRTHLVCTSNPARLPWLEQQGVKNPAFLMSAFSPTFHSPAPTRSPKREVAFLGTPGRKGQRVRFLAEISRHFNTEIFGRGWGPYLSDHPHLRVRAPVRNRAYARVCASSQIVLGLNEVNSERQYFSNRTWLTLGCKAFHLTHYVPGLEEVFVNGEHLAWFHDLDEFVKLARVYLQLHEKRGRIAAAGHQLVLREHRYSDRVAAILDLIENGTRSPTTGSVESEQLVSAGAPAVPIADCRE